MDQISQHINSTNHKIRSYDQMSKMIVRLDSNKGEKNYDPSNKISPPHNPLLMSIVETPEKDLYHGEEKEVISKVCTLWVKSYSKLFLC